MQSSQATCQCAAAVYEFPQLLLAEVSHAVSNILVSRHDML